MSRRQVVLDTETTGLSVEQGHRIIEIGALELVGRRPTGARFHRFVNPGRSIDEGAQAVHGISSAFLEDKPTFAEVAADFVSFVEGAELLIHNAPFDVGFIDAELGRLGGSVRRLAELAEITDTLALAREIYPGQPNSLDRLCKRLGVDNSQRDLHGALLDAQLLADVYLAMTSGQGALDLSTEGVEQRELRTDPESARARAGAWRIAVVRASDEENQAHRRRLEGMRARSGRCLWMDSEVQGDQAP